MRFWEHRALCAAVGAVLLGWTCLPVRAQSDSVGEAGAVFVTAPGADGTLRTTPHGTSVITAAEIARSTATNVADLLAREPNLNLQSYFGNAKYATIDIRGMGATASSNVVVLVNGVRLNEYDLSSPDLSTIPLAEIERVEIVRGGGAVLYGDGAVGGVINIITRGAGSGERTLSVQAGVASYSTTDLRVNATGGSGPLQAAINLSAFDTDGYRENGGVWARDAMLELQLVPPGLATPVELYARAALHKDTTGLPGPVSAEAFADGSSARRASSFPNDESSTTDQFYTLGGIVNFGEAGKLDVQAHYRDRDNPYVLGFSPLIPLADQQSRITSRRGDLQMRYDWPFDAFGFSHSASVGIDLQRADYTRAEGGENRVDASTRRLGQVDASGYYATTTLRGPHALTLNAGVRFSRFGTTEQDQRYTSQCDTIFETVLVDIGGGIFIPIQVPRLVNCVNAYRTEAGQSNVWKNIGAEIGLTWEASSAFVGFVSATKNFRNPNIDELLLAASSLRPQTGYTYEIGGRYNNAAARLELAATAFYMEINDEIYYTFNPATNSSLNLNFDSPTRRVGGELELRWQALPDWTVSGGLGYVDARFTGSYAQVPLVPAVTASARLEWEPRAWLSWAFLARYVGERFDGNDFTNTQYPPLAAYVVCDTVLRLERGKWQVTAGINNLFNEIYSTVGYSGTFYPMPERNYYLALRATF